MTDTLTPVALSVVLLGVILAISASVEKGKDRKPVVKRLKEHFGKDPKQLPISRRVMSKLDFPNLHVAVRRFAEQNGVKEEMFGAVGFHGAGLGAIVNESYYVRSTIGPLQYQSVDIDVGRQMQCALNAIYLVKTKTGPAAIQIQLSGQVELVVMALNVDSASEYLEEIRKLSSESSVYRGKIISFEGEEGNADEPGWLNVRFHRIPDVSRDEIILPRETMDVIERNIINFYRHTNILRKSGRSVKRGILFYGSPGTGKTFTAKYLSHAMPGITVFLLAGEQLWLMKECFQMARMLAPALIIMEDVDLIAEKRERSVNNTVLHQLLDQLDGLSEKADVITLLTTNRPEVLEPALSLRPGRIDQAIKFPMPDEECRRRLFELYSQGLDVRLNDLSRYIAKTDGASPSFIQELLRKAALFAAEDSYDHTETLVVLDSHLDRALEELLLSSPLTRQILGFRASRVDSG